MAPPRVPQAMAPFRAQAPGPPEAGRAAARRKPRNARLRGCPHRRILGMRVDATSYEHATETLLELAGAARGGRVCVATVHTVMECADDPSFRRAVNGAELVTPDGMPLVWGLRRLGVSGATRVYGPTLLPFVCERAAARGVPVGFYGGSEAVLHAMVAALRRRAPGLDVRLAASPPFRPLTEAEDAAAVRDIRESGARILFVGLGCPKQERWMATHRDALPCVQVGVGAAFDFAAGAKPQAPRVLRDAGLEWLFRLACEPRRLGRRYLVHNPRFALRFARQLVRHRSRRSAR